MGSSGFVVRKSTESESLEKWSANAGQTGTILFPFPLKNTKNNKTGEGRGKRLGVRVGVGGG